ncbi:peroxidase family protein [Tabrizicola sp. M-4]|uniref:peroxidase family protein n=1 Tax=Tabrizicola sp. M-4 TaxID=3055847 RepID=UPI003DA7DF5D
MVFIRSTHDLMELAGGAPAGGVARQSRYGYLFPALADEPGVGCFAGTDEAETLARLRAFEEATHLPVNPPSALLMRLPAAYTYFGQFVNHDISAPVGGVAAADAPAPVGVIGPAEPQGLGQTWRADRQTILARVVNEQGRPLMLGSLYGDWPDTDDPGIAALFARDGKRFRLARVAAVKDVEFTDIDVDPATVLRATGAPDLPRRGREAVIADRRNDGNLILSQMHLAFLRVHNRAVAALEPAIRDDAACFRAARRLVTLHYHWLILNDFLPRILSRTVLTRPLAEWASRLAAAREVPMEFTTAAFRFGHSMVGRAYDFNANFGAGGKIAGEAKLIELFRFTSAQNMGHPEGPARQVPEHWVIDWERVTAGGMARPGGAHAGAERIDLNFAPDMLNVAGDAAVPEQGSILFRNLMRGFHRRIPFGQRLADAYGVERLTLQQMRAALPRRRSPGGAFASPLVAADALGFMEEMPAWLYFLCEAKALERGARVGPTASRIIADTIVGLMRGEEESLLRVARGGWHPRDSLLRDREGRALETLRGFLLFSQEG